MSTNSHQAGTCIIFPNPCFLISHFSFLSLNILLFVSNHYYGSCPVFLNKRDLTLNSAFSTSKSIPGIPCISQKAKDMPTDSSSLAFISVHSSWYLLLHNKEIAGKSLRMEKGNVHRNERGNQLHFYPGGIISSGL